MSEPKVDLDSLSVEAWDVERPIDSTNNNKIHTEESLTRLARSMADLGQITPIVVDKRGIIIAGHGRRLAARRLGWAKIKVIQLPVDEITARKMRLADNLTSNQLFDDNAITSELRELRELGLNLEEITPGLGINNRLLDIVQTDRNVEMNADVLSGDVATDVESFSREGERKMSDADSKETHVGKALGFTKLTPAQTRTIKRFIAQVISETGKSDPAAALVAWIEELEA